MKKVFYFIISWLIASTANAQSNYAGSSKFFDNWSVTLQGGVATSFSNFFSGHTATAPIVVIGTDKYINPWFGVGIEGRTLIGTGHGHVDGICYSDVPNAYNTHTAFDAVNVSAYAKFNIINMFNYNGKRHFFEPVIYVGPGWGHQTCSNSFDRNYLTFRSGAELNFNLGKERAWAITVNPSVVWGDINNGKLMKSHGYFEATAGVVYHFKTSNGTHSINKINVKALNDKVNYLYAENEDLKHQTKQLADSLSKKPKIVTVTEFDTTDNSYSVSFDKGSSKVGDVTKIAEALKKTTGTITIVGSTSPEGSEKLNKKLATARAEAVKKALVKAGIKESRIIVNNNYENQRRATITVTK